MFIERLANVSLHSHLICKLVLNCALRDGLPACPTMGTYLVTNWQQSQFPIQDLTVEKSLLLPSIWNEVTAFHATLHTNSATQLRNAIRAGLLAEPEIFRKSAAPRTCSCVNSTSEAKQFSCINPCSCAQMSRGSGNATKFRV